MEVNGQLHALGTFPLQKEVLVPTAWEAGWAPEPFPVAYSKAKLKSSGDNASPFR